MAQTLSRSNHQIYAATDSLAATRARGNSQPASRDWELMAIEAAVVILSVLLWSLAAPQQSPLEASASVGHLQAKTQPAEMSAGPAGEFPTSQSSLDNTAR